MRVQLFAEAITAIQAMDRYLVDVEVVYVVPRVGVTVYFRKDEGLVNPDSSYNYSDIRDLVNSLGRSIDPTYELNLYPCPGVAKHVVPMCLFISERGY